MRITLKPYPEGTVIVHVPLFPLQRTIKIEELTDGQVWLDELAKVAARSALTSAATIRTAEQFQVLVELFEGAAQAVKNPSLNKPPLHPPEDKFECTYVALALAVYGKPAIPGNFGPLKKQHSAAASLTDRCLVWQHLNEVRAGLDAIRRFLPQRHSELELTAWNRGKDLIALDTSMPNQFLNGIDLPKTRLRIPEFEMPSFTQLLQDFSQELGNALTPSHGVDPLIVQLLLMLEHQGDVEPGNRGASIFMRSQKEWLRAFDSISDVFVGVSPNLMKLSRIERSQAFISTINRFIQNSKKISEEANEKVANEHHYWTPRWLPIALNAADQLGRRLICMAVTANYVLYTSYVTDLLTRPQQYAEDREAHELVEKWAEAVDWELAARQIRHAFPNAEVSAEGSWVNRQMFVAPHLKSQIAGVSMHREVHPHPDGGECGDLDILVLDIQRREIRVVEIKRFPSDRRWRDLGPSFARFWGRVGKERGAFQQLKRKLEWLELYREKMKLSGKENSLATWRIRGCILSTALPRVLWVTDTHLNAVAELGSTVGRQFLTGEDADFGVSVSATIRAPNTA